MIFYTLHGPSFHLEIHDDRLKLVRKGWSKLFAPKKEVLEWKLGELSHFQITAPKLIWGKLEWSTFDGTRGSFRFTTNSQMVVKIEKYLHKLILKNLNRRQDIGHDERPGQSLAFKSSAQAA